jgi:ubiquinone biosynthesis protein UbiJ
LTTELRAAAERALHRQLVDVFAALLGLSIDRHGDVIRHALAQVIPGLESVETSQRTIGAEIQRHFDLLSRLRHDLHELETKLKRLTNRVEDTELNLDMKEAVPF